MKKDERGNKWIKKLKWKKKIKKLKNKNMK